MEKATKILVMATLASVIVFPMTATLAVLVVTDLVNTMERGNRRPALRVKNSSPGSPEHSEPRGKQPVRRASPSALTFKTTVFSPESRDRPVGVTSRPVFH